MAHWLKNLSAMQESRVQSLGWEDPLGQGMTTHSVFLPRESHGQSGLVGCKESDTTVTKHCSAWTTANMVKFWFHQLQNYVTLGNSFDSSGSQNTFHKMRAEQHIAKVLSSMSVLKLINTFNFSLFWGQTKFLQDYRTKSYNSCIGYPLLCNKLL